MKDIKDMNLAELADRVESDEDIYHDEYVFVERLRQLHDLNRWIPVSERMPTEADGLSVITINKNMKCCITLWHNLHKLAEPATHWQPITPPEDKP